MVLPNVWRTLSLLCSLGVMTEQMSGAIAGRGPGQNDAQLSFDITRSLTQMEPVVAVFHATNASSRRWFIDLGEDRITNFAMEVTPPAGMATAAKLLNRSGIAEIILDSWVKPGDTYAQDIVLSRWFDFSKEGVYSVKLTFIGPIKFEGGASVSPLGQIGTGTIQIGPRDADRLRAACSRLARVAFTERPNAVPTRTAVEAVASVKDPVAIPFLVEFIKRRLFPAIPVGGLERMGTPEARQELETFALGPNADIAALARSALARWK